MVSSRPTVVTTRDRRGRLDELLVGAGIDVIHVPLIEITPGENPALTTTLDRLDTFDWLVVTSVHGAERVGRAAATSPALRLAAVGTATARRLAELAGRDVDLVPQRQTGAALVDAFEPSTASERVVVAQADRADSTVIDGLTRLGYQPTAVIAYNTALRRPSRDERVSMLGADGVAFASGSAVTAWSETIGTATPPIVAAIGPTTAEVAAELGLQVTHIAADHSVEGLATTIITALTTGGDQATGGETSPLPVDDLG